MAPNGTTFDFVFPDPAASDPSAKLPAAGIAIDSAGNVFTAATMDIVEIAPGAGIGRYLGSLGGPGPLHPVIGPSLAVDGAGNLYSGFSVGGGTGILGWLPIGYPDWLTLDSGYQDAVYETVVAGPDLYFAGTSVLVLKPGAASLATVIAASPMKPKHIAIDSHGNLLAWGPQTGTTKTAVYELPAGGTNWTLTSPLVLSTGNGGEATNFVIDAHGNAYIVASDATTPARSASLFELPVGSSTWTKLFDIPGLLADERCAPNGSLADDHIGHLILQCASTLLRSQP